MRLRKRSVAAAPFVIVYGSQGSASATAALLRGALLLSTGHVVAAHAFAPVVRDDELELCVEPTAAPASVSSMCLPCGSHLILVGGPAQNSWTRRLHARPQHGFQAVRFEEGLDGGLGPFIRVGGRVFREPGVGLLTSVGWYDSRAACAVWSGDAPFAALDSRASAAQLALVVAGTDAQGLFTALRFSAPTVPPMVRSPFSNLIPDFVVFGITTLGAGFGGVKLAGYFDSEWGVDAALLFDRKG